MNEHLRCNRMKASARLAMLTLACTLLILGAPASARDEAPATVSAEVAALLATLETPGCRFQRNGHWHTGTEARHHLTTKWQKMERRGLVQSTEGFIDTGASGSSLSGQPYLVQCDDAPAQPSRVWLNAKLRLMRAGTK